MYAIVNVFLLMRMANKNKKKDDDDDDDDGEVKIMFSPKRTTEIIYVCYQKATLSVSCQIFILSNNYLLSKSSCVQINFLVRKCKDSVISYNEISYRFTSGYQRSTQSVHSQ